MYITLLVLQLTATRDLYLVHTHACDNVGAEARGVGGDKLKLRLSRENCGGGVVVLHEFGDLVDALIGALEVLELSEVLQQEVDPMRAALHARDPATGATGSWEEGTGLFSDIQIYIAAVSYTHLTLPTNREV